jgi:hypothetical protein
VWGAEVQRHHAQAQLRPDGRGEVQAHGALELHRTVVAAHHQHAHVRAAAVHRIAQHALQAQQQQRCNLI